MASAGVIDFRDPQTGVDGGASGVGGGVGGGDEPKKLTREDWRKKKELEEQRKLGNAPAEVDEEGRDINPHIPQYISSVPWYVDPSKRPTLKHQRPQPERQYEFTDCSQWFHRGVNTQTVATKFRKGACCNCGATTHKKKDCMERPRRVGARHTGADIAPDEFAQPTLAFDFDGKRDRWNGYDPSEHSRIVHEYAKIDSAKRQLKAQKLQEELASGNLESVVHEKDNSGDEDEDKYADDVDMPGTNFDSKRRITVRNLRIREDTAKYLRNLDPNSAYYDPKTRSMRENPYSSTGKTEEEVSFAGDNFVRFTGDTSEIADAQLFAWEATERGTDVHLQADPTKLELLSKSFSVKKETYKSQQRHSILEKYGGLEHLEGLPRELLLAQTEEYVEFSRHGGVLRGQQRAVARSKYEEDCLANNHTEVWGSYWRAGQWGYHCCHSLVKLSYCTGERGKGDPGEILHEVDAELELVEQSAPRTLMEMHQARLRVGDLHKTRVAKRSRQEEAAEAARLHAEREQKIQLAMDAEEERCRRVDALMRLDERKRPYNSAMTVTAGVVRPAGRGDDSVPTEEEMEAFRRKRPHPEDPMGAFLAP
ncbi:pre-mRNA-splicing factor SLU7 [Lampetra fluviatilis]